MVGPLYDRYGPRWLLAIGTFLNVFGLMMSSISDRYYQFLLSQGLCTGIGAAMLFFPAVSCVMTYFNAKRATALGIATSGAGVGGVILPLVFHEMVDSAGYGWTLRTIAFIVLFLGIVAQLTITSRLPPTPKKASAKEMAATLKDKIFLLVTVAGFFTYITIFTGNTFIVVTAIHRGVDVSWSFYLVPILNTGSFFGRLLPGPLADRLGIITMFNIMTLLTFLVVACVWIPVSGTAGMVMFAILFGFTTGCLLSLAPGVVSIIGEMKTLGLRMGVTYMFAGLSTLFGSPLGGAIIVSLLGTLNLSALRLFLVADETSIFPDGEWVQSHAGLYSCPRGCQLLPCLRCQVQPGELESEEGLMIRPDYGYLGRCLRLL